MHMLLSKIDPRRSLASAIGWTMALVMLVGAWLASLWVGDLARARIERQIGALHRQYAIQISNVLDQSVFDRKQWVVAVARVLSSAPEGEGASRQSTTLDRVRSSLPDTEWMIVADGQGRVSAASGGVAAGGTVRDRAWFIEGGKAAWVGESHAKPPVPVVPGAALEDAGPALDFAAPVTDDAGTLRGVVGLRVSWRWVARLESELTSALRTQQAIESLLLDAAGRVRIGPPDLVGRTVPLPPGRSPGTSGQYAERWPDGVDYLSGYAVADGFDSFPGLGWIVVVRQPLHVAYAEAGTLVRQIFGTLLVLGLVGGALAMLIARRLTRRLAVIAQTADAIRDGSSAVLTPPAGADEAARIGRSLTLLIESLRREQERLRAFNAELDARVAARTREVERMSDENKYAAVVRERLRMARDLHDTLAHSMMALLTEIRVLRSLSARSPESLPEELANAEAAAEEGLRQAREAITALRYDIVRDAGLGAALRQLARRFAERSGIEPAVDIDPVVDRIADARAETVYRIVEEALRNVDRHAMARHVALAAAVIDAQDKGAVLDVAVEDDGTGFDADGPWPGHYGLRGMREQAELIGATVDIVSTPDRGTRIRVTLPL